eukprot:12683238-Heterocapsa_arctica.AAC.1
MAAWILHELLRQVPAREVQMENSMRQRVAFIDRHGVGNAAAGVHDLTCGAAQDVQGEHHLDHD